MPSDKNEAAIANAIAEFERDNKEVLEAARVFGISYEEYQKVLLALQPHSAFTSASTQDGAHAILG